MTSLTDPQTVLTARARALAARPAASAGQGEHLELITFHLDDEYFGVVASLVQEIQPLRARHWARVPNTPGFIVGLINLRGRLYSITDHARFVGRPPRPLAPKAHVLLVRQVGAAAMELALLADDVPQAETVFLESLLPPPPNMSALTQEFVRGVTPELLIVLDLARLLADPRLVVRDE